MFLKESIISKATKNGKITFLFFIILVISTVTFGCGGNNSATTQANVDDSKNGSSSIKNAKLVSEYEWRSATADNMDTVKFGNYPQSDTSGNKSDSIEWFVLDKKDGKALLFSKYILDKAKYKNSNIDTTWESSDLRIWLNNDFLNKAFNSKEQNNIVLSHLNNYYITPYQKDMGSNDNRGGNDTDDKVFVLSESEIDEYFKSDYNNKERATDGTPYNAMNQKLFWLRNPGDSNNIARVYESGCGVYSYGVDADYIGVRPAIWVQYE